MYAYHYARQELINSAPNTLFSYLDDPSRLSAHMERSSWRMGGGEMSIELGGGNWQQVDSTALMRGTAFGMSLQVRSRLTEYAPPRKKAWETIGEPHLLVIGGYRMGVEVTDASMGALLRVFIDYNRPSHFPARLLGALFGRSYARWCVNTMATDARDHFLK